METKTYNDSFNPSDYSESMTEGTIEEVGAQQANGTAAAPAKPKPKKTVREAGKKVEEKSEIPETFFLVNEAGEVVEESDANRAAAQAILNTGLTLYRGVKITPSVSFQ